MVVLLDVISCVTCPNSRTPDNLHGSSHRSATGLSKFVDSYPFSHQHSMRAALMILYFAASSALREERSQPLNQGDAGHQMLKTSGEEASILEVSGQETDVSVVFQGGFDAEGEKERAQRLVKKCLSDFNVQKDDDSVALCISLSFSHKFRSSWGNTVTYNVFIWEEAHRPKMNYAWSHKSMQLEWTGNGSKKVILIFDK